MENSPQDKTPMPTLTLDPDAAESQMQADPFGSFGVQNQQKAAAPQFTPEEQKQINAFASQIDLNNSTQILNYGSAAQKKSVKFSDAALKSVRTKDFGEIGDLLTTMTVEIKNLDQEEKGGIRGFFQKKKNKVEIIRARYANTEENMNKVVDALENHQYTLLKDIAMLDKLYDQNQVYFKELSMYIAAGQQKLEQVRAVDLPQLQQKAAATNLQEDVQAVNDLAAMCTRFEKKIHDLELTRTISLQTAPQIRLVQNDDSIMAEKIQSAILNTIPLWKNQMVLALGVQHANQAAKAEKMVTDATNDMLRKNADMLKQTTVMAAEANERSIIDIDTLKHTNEALLSTIDEVLRIQEEGQQRRKSAEAELVQIEQELKDKLLESGSRISTGRNATHE
ncbi:toxic anion resistance protein [Eubacterium sp. F2]|uniref:toxic anion resistance protein n=1 Tax=Eubacterium sp. F2 TaxID=3381348 RepID=UPI0039082DDA